jgi:WD40 repeat protein
MFITGHSAGLVSIHFIDKMLASGCVDGLIRVWNLEAGCSFSLRGHRNWANKIHILPGKKQLLSCSDDNTMVFVFIMVGFVGYCLSKGYSNVQWSYWASSNLGFDETIS